ncbi:Metallo-dependent phosphatase [Tothia fuscella]|uniref:Metallo-dependent phosphatase n=1 Tax=Tothia fuscella TaxID=1048955 RepID=A0A9P4U185_9PEZI|nr:Metallo-dependent phosphatase [Tothia fuscella]
MFFSQNRNPFEPPTLRERILSSPVKYLLTLTYTFFTQLRSPPIPLKPTVRVVCISDTHTHTWDDIPSGDILIHAGDLTNAGTIKELQHQINWIDSLPHKHKIAICGNHDTYLDTKSRKHLTEEERNGELNWKSIHYLQHTSTTLTLKTPDYGTRKINIYGAPQIPQCGGENFAFQYNRDRDAWSNTVPDDTDILVTHTPPRYHRDLFAPWMGCCYLLEEVWRVRPALHVFGHVHSGAGREVCFWDEGQRVYERGLGRDTGKGFVRGVLSVGSWVDLVGVVYLGVLGVVWDRVWGGEGKSTVMVNASLMYRNTGRLGNGVQVVDI